MSEKNISMYLGDGLYASYDGYQIKLETKNFDKNEVYLEPGVVDNFMLFAGQCFNCEIKISNRNTDPFAVGSEG